VNTTQQITKDSNSATIRKSDEQVNTNHCESKDQRIKSHSKKIHYVQKDTREEMSTAVSEGSKSKIFGRIVDMMVQNKQRAFVPNTIVEETFIVDKSKSASSKASLRKSIEKNLSPKKIVPGKISNIDIEESKKSKNISNKARHIIESRKPTSKDIDPEKVISEKYSQSQAVRKPTVGQRAKEISQMKKQSANSAWTVIDDSTIVVQKAISNGNLKAVQSNEDDDDVPLNYLTIMLKDKLKEEKRKGYRNPKATKIKDNHEQQRSHGKPDADSFVAAIRGPRLQEAPGVALEEIAIRNHPNNREPSIVNEENKIRTDLAPTPRRSNNILEKIAIRNYPNNRDPSIVNVENKIRTDLAPTPRRSNNILEERDPSVVNAENKIRTDLAPTPRRSNNISAFVDKEEIQNNTRDPSLQDKEDERQRKRMITERLFQAGSPSFGNENESEKNIPRDVIKTVPTVETSESYEDHDTVEAAVNSEINEKKNNDATASNLRIESSRNRRRLSISFLKSGKRNK